MSAQTPAQQSATEPTPKPTAGSTAAAAPEKGGAHAAPSDTPTVRARVRRASLSSWIGAAVMLAVLAVLAMGPYVFDRGLQQRLVLLFALVVMGTAWNLLAGYGGMVSIGQQAFVGLGAYGLVYFGDVLGLSPFVAIVVGVLVAGLVSIPISWLTFRLVGGYFAIGTWVVAEVLRLVVAQTDAVGGGAGFTVRSFGGLDAVYRIAFVYWFGLAGAVVMVAATYLLMRSRLGLGFTAIRDDAVAAASLGVRVTLSKRIVYVVAAMGAAFGGGLTAANTLRVQPDSAFSISFTVAMIFVVVIGGIGSIEGPIVGAIVYWVLQDQLAQLGSWYLVILGAIVIAVTLYAPRGLWGLVSRGGRLRPFPVGYRLLDLPSAPSRTTAAAGAAAPDTPERN
ncbi:branched-chain amino acid ABC transporter permease [Nocardioides sp. GY 10127]|uniref:branched-chain amino acid ABC transporter permease n=1 Tax=Nocardioides sp. GY 10127 TaxID=2569762 RepID=UPI0010A8D70D|nr:branched-chain amino acid ABC transporter permease [Nocardioides sp. GY 10127]TIC81769.1 branched-chain amino acid ABC transporter permease [Nocardioides sp. GY 10127]